MSRPVETGIPVIDSFPVFEDDGYTTKSGLLESDFEIKVFVDATLVSVPVSINEIGTTGNYRMEFTPWMDAIYQVQVLSSYNDDIWGSTYESGPVNISQALDTALADLMLVKGLLHQNAMLDNQVYDAGFLTAARLRVFDSASHVPTMPGGSETAGMLAEFVISATYATPGINNKFTLTRVYP
jgi:hypothetical protein